MKFVTPQERNAIVVARAQALARIQSQQTIQQPQAIVKSQSTPQTPEQVTRRFVIKQI
jgi:hypothetical protein